MKTLLLLLALGSSAFAGLVPIATTVTAFGGTTVQTSFHIGLLVGTQVVNYTITFTIVPDPLPTPTPTVTPTATPKPTP